MFVKDDVLSRVLNPDTSDMPRAYRLADHSRIHSWEDYSKQMDDEYRQCEGEGLDIEALKPAFEAIRQMEPGAFRALAADRLFELIGQCKTRADFNYEEPSDLEGILAARPAHDKRLRKADASRLPEQLRGAWYGRIAGCLLGKTVEGIRTEELLPFLRDSGNLPMHRYIVSGDVPQDAPSRYRFDFQHRCYADKLSFAPADDDTNYTCLYQQLIEKYGRDFTSNDVCAIWQNRQPKTAYCTAERVAYMNMNRGLTPPHTATYENAYREWIGAQIRGDYFGYINPGDPKTAAEMAWRDACVSHVKNGIYGEMFIAAMLAWAAVESDLMEIIRAGLDEIPKNCRLQKEVEQLLELYRAGESEEKAFSWIHALYDEHTGYGWCHTNPNALIVCASMLWTGGDFGRAICRAVQTGFDTDCNGATVGSILGLRGGIDCIEQRWLAPLGGQLNTNIIGVGCASIDELVSTTLKHIGA